MTNLDGTFFLSHKVCVTGGPRRVGSMYTLNNADSGGFSKKDGTIQVGKRCPNLLGEDFSCLFSHKENVFAVMFSSRASTYILSEKQGGT